jgi:hypothetical protein
MTAATDSYRVRPRKSRGGWILEGERLSHGFLWYRNEDAAISYAKWNSRVNGCRVEILDERNEVVRVEEFSSGDFAW